MFLITDTQLKEESFLEDVDGLLNAGEVANLFPLDEKQDIIEVTGYWFSACHMLVYSPLTSPTGYAAISCSREQGC